MKPERPDGAGTPANESQPRPVRKPYTSPKVTPHGKLPPLTLSSSVTTDGS
jgi:hypothetical protein